MTLCRARGGELFDYLTRMVKLSEKKSRHIVHQLLLAVCHMHRHDVVHRDLKVRWAGLHHHHHHMT